MPDSLTLGKVANFLNADLHRCLNDHESKSGLDHRKAKSVAKNLGDDQGRNRSFSHKLVKAYSKQDHSKTSDTLGDDDSTRPIDKIESLDKATIADLSFYNGDPAYRDLLSQTVALAVILKQEALIYCPSFALVVKDPYLAYAKVSKLFSTKHKLKTTPTIHVSTVIHPQAKLDANVDIAEYSSVGENTVIGDGTCLGANVSIGANCNLGRNCRLDSGVRLVANVQIGDNVVIHNNTVIGSDGFGYAWDGKTWEKIHQLGGVCIGNDVEIGAMNTINSGALKDTKIGNRVKTDCHVHVAHNAVIDDDTVMAAGAMVAGSAYIGKRCRLGGAVRVLNNLTVVDDVELVLGSCVMRDIKKAGRYCGIPAYALRDWRRNAIRIPKLHTVFNRLKNLELKIMRK